MTRPKPSASNTSSPNTSNIGKSGIGQAASRRKAELAAASILVPAQQPGPAQPPTNAEVPQPAATEEQTHSPLPTRVSWLRRRMQDRRPSPEQTTSIPLDEDADWSPAPDPAQAPSSAPTAEALWQARAIRYCFIYLLLASAVLTLRYTTQNTYPQLRDLRGEVSDLQTQRDTLDLQVQQLTTGPRVLDWAKAHGMIPYAQARKQSQSFTPLNAPPTPMPVTPLEMTTQWK